MPLVLFQFHFDFVTGFAVFLHTLLGLTRKAGADGISGRLQWSSPIVFNDPFDLKGLLLILTSLGMPYGKKYCKDCEQSLAHWHQIG
jgi:hypothetical protein